MGKKKSSLFCVIIKTPTLKNMDTSSGRFRLVARYQSREDSDVDICIKTVTPNPFVLVHIKEDIEQLVHRRVDIVRVREKMNPFLKQHIEKEGIYV